jgi:hypothetical protein
MVRFTDLGFAQHHIRCPESWAVDQSPEAEAKRATDQWPRPQFRESLAVLWLSRNSNRTGECWVDTGFRPVGTGCSGLKLSPNAVEATAPMLHIASTDDVTNLLAVHNLSPHLISFCGYTRYERSRKSRVQSSLGSISKNPGCNTVAIFPTGPVQGGQARVHNQIYRRSYEFV